MWNSEHEKNADEHKGLEWFGPPESETLRPVWGGIAHRREVPKNGAPGRLIWSWARASIQGRWTLIWVSCKLGRPPSLIIG
jgi:hypothetical protein